MGVFTSSFSIKFNIYKPRKIVDSDLKQGQNYF